MIQKIKYVISSGTYTQGQSLDLIIKNLVLQVLTLNSMTKFILSKKCG